MIANKIMHSPDPPAPQTKADLILRLDEITADNAALRKRVAELELPPDEPMIALKPAAYACGMDDETVRVWCVAGHVEAAQDGRRWFIRLSSLKARALRFGYRPIG